MKNVKRLLFKLKYVVALAVFLVTIGFVGESSLVNRMGQQMEINQLKEDIEEYTRKFERDKKTLDALKHDPEAVREVARGRYYMKTDDEDIFIVDDEDLTSSDKQ